MLDKTRWWEAEGWPPPVLPFVVLMRALLEDRLSPVEMEVVFFRVWGGDPFMHGPEEYEPLAEFFYAVEDYCHEDRLREPEDIDEAEMRARTRHALETLRQRIPLPENPGGDGG